MSAVSLELKSLGEGLSRRSAAYIATPGLPESSEAHRPSSRLGDSTVNIRNESSRPGAPVRG